MLKYFFIMCLFTGFAAVPSSAQVKDERNQSPNDSTIKIISPDTYFNKLLPDSLSNFKIIKRSRNENLYHNLEQDIFQYRYNCLDMPDRDSIFSDKLSIVKKNLTNYFKSKYDEIPNYDLGIVGRYLGTAKTIMTIILAILSL